MADIYTQAGEEVVVDLIDNTVAAFTPFIGWGTAAGTFVKGTTTLFTEASESRVAAATSQPSADQNRFIATIVADGTKTITNAGVLDASSGGNLVLGSDFAGVPVVLNDSTRQLRPTRSESRGRCPVWD